MRFIFCPDCGARLTQRDLGDDPDIPWCERCSKPWFPVFPTCIIALVHDGRGNVLLLHQDYISTTYANLVSGYMQPGETAELTAIREIKEETGLTVNDLHLTGTYWFGKKQILMIGFIAQVQSPEGLSLSQEVDSAGWHRAQEAVGLVHPEGSVSHTLCSLFLRMCHSAS